MKWIVIAVILILLGGLISAQVRLTPDNIQGSGYFDYDVPAYFEYGDTVPSYTTAYWLDTFPKLLQTKKLISSQILIIGHTDFNEEAKLDSSLSLGRAHWLK